eukprot:5170413-Pleurochrysis_carterae.AAC.1
MPVPDIWIMPDPSRTRVCPAANAIMIAVVASRTHAIVELFRRVRSGGGMTCAVAECTTAVRRRVVLDYGACQRRRETLPAWQALGPAWDAAPALALSTLSAGSRGRRAGVARVLRA